jgi:NAD(P)H-hydrate epimerase
VSVYLFSASGQFSADNHTNQQRLTDAGVDIQTLHTLDLPALSSRDVLVEALFGTGLTRPLEGRAKELVASLNALSARRIAIDLPAGMFSEEEYNSAHTVFHAAYTLSFQVPKLCFFLPSCADALGKWILLDIGLSPSFLAQQKSSYFLLNAEDLTPMLHQRKPFSHKGTFGHALLVAGSYGKIGAAVLATLAALRSGSGLVTTLVPECGYTILQSSAPEAMVLTSGARYIDALPDLSRFSSVALGPGLGQDPATARALLAFLRQHGKPLVLDADALNILAAQEDWPSLLPPGTILTPHPGEFDRLFGAHTSTLTRIETQAHFAKTQGVCVILKGRYTSIALPDGRVFFNRTGNPGMATGGSGDVLSGILAGLLAQAYTPEESALLGVYLHGLAGDLARTSQGEEALVASDLIAHLGGAFKVLHQLAVK